MVYESTEAGSELRNIVVDHVVLVQELPPVVSAAFSTKRTEMLNALQAYHGFTVDLYEAQQAWYKIKEENGELWADESPRYPKPFKYSGRFEVAVDDKMATRVSSLSRAVWRRSMPTLICEDCGQTGAEFCCPQLCDPCQSRIRF